MCVSTPWPTAAAADVAAVESGRVPTKVHPLTASTSRIADPHYQVQDCGPAPKSPGLTCNRGKPFK